MNNYNKIRDDKAEEENSTWGVKAQAYCNIDIVYSKGFDAGFNFALDILKSQGGSKISDPRYHEGMCNGAANWLEQQRDTE